MFIPLIQPFLGNTNSLFNSSSPGQEIVEDIGQQTIPVAQPGPVVFAGRSPNDGLSYGEVGGIVVRSWPVLLRRRSWV